MDVPGVRQNGVEAYGAVNSTKVPRFVPKFDDKMFGDLSTIHTPMGALFSADIRASDFERYRLSAEQVDFYHEYGYLQGVRILDDAQIETLRAELPVLMDSANSAHDLFYEFNSNESAARRKYFFTHSVRGEYRPRSMTCSGIRPLLYRHRSCWAEPSDCGMTNCFVSLHMTVELSSGIRIIPTGRVQSPWPI